MVYRYELYYDKGDNSEFDGYSSGYVIDDSFQGAASSLEYRFDGRVMKGVILEVFSDADDGIVEIETQSPAEKEYLSKVINVAPPQFQVGENGVELVDNAPTVSSESSSEDVPEDNIYDTQVEEVE